MKFYAFRSIGNFLKNSMENYNICVQRINMTKYKHNYASSKANTKEVFSKLVELNKNWGFGGR